MIGGEERSPDLTKSYIPFLTTISLVVFVAWATYIVTDAVNKFHSRVESTVLIVKELAFTTKELTSVVQSRTDNWWSRHDMVLWCIEQKQKYVELACPPTGELRGTGSFRGQSDRLDRTQQRLDRLHEDAEKTLLNRVEPPNVNDK
jgi:hypothetical protein